MTEPLSTTTILLYIKVAILFLIPFVEPQLAGMLGALAYLIVRHELNMAEFGVRSAMTVMFFGWMGAWAAVNVLAGYPQFRNEHVQIISATVGFLSYDAMMMFGRNTQSVLGFAVVIIKSMIEKVVKKWNS